MKFSGAKYTVQKQELGITRLFNPFGFYLAIEIPTENAKYPEGLTPTSPHQIKKRIKAGQI
jgi:hypothetical protein